MINNTDAYKKRSGIKKAEKRYVEKIVYPIKKRRFCEDSRVNAKKRAIKRITPVQKNTILNTNVKILKIFNLVFI